MAMPWSSELTEIGLSLTPYLILFGTICTFVMGYAIQRGSTCLVAAIEELLHMRRGSRLAAIAEASIWVAGGMAIARLAGFAVTVPQPSTTVAWAIAGGLLFGAGACVNGACAFGTVARLGSGQWAYAFTPIGILAGDIAFVHLHRMMAAGMFSASTGLIEHGWLLAPIIGLLAWRALGVGGALARRPLVAHPSTAHLATIGIALTFLAMFLTVGPWAYTDVIADIARNGGSTRDGRWILIASLFAGAVFGGWHGGRLRLQSPSVRTALRCLVGGALMGWGADLIPGGNDGLLLIGMPLLRPYAWIAAAAMAAAILVLLTISRRSHSGIAAG